MIIEININRLSKSQQIIQSWQYIQYQFKKISAIIVNFINSQLILYNNYLLFYMQFPTFYFLRHAESQFNNAILEIRQKYSLQWPKEIYHTEQYKKLQQNRKYFDCDLSEQGYKQCQKAKQELKDLQIDIILVSPYYRALVTCEEVFKNHKSKPKIIVEPLLGQKINSPCDIGARLNQSIKMFEYDFSALNGTNLNKWYLQNLQQSTRQKIQNALKVDNVEDANQIARITLQFITNGQEQTWQNISIRAQKFKNKVAEYHKKNKKVLFVGHSFIFKAITATGFREDGQPINDVYVPNGTVAKIGILFPKSNGSEQKKNLTS